jgi:uncharacterized membrane protein
MENYHLYCRDVACNISTFYSINICVTPTFNYNGTPLPGYLFREIFYFLLTSFVQTTSQLTTGRSIIFIVEINGIGYSILYSLHKST